MKNNYNNLPVIITAVTSDQPISDVPCGTCTRCCEILAPMLSPDEITSGLYPLSFTNPTAQQKKENPDSNIIVTLYRKPNGGCVCLLMVVVLSMTHDPRPVSNLIDEKVTTQSW